MPDPFTMAFGPGILRPSARSTQRVAVNRLAASAVLAALLPAVIVPAAAVAASTKAGHHSACQPSNTVLHADVVPVHGLTPQQVTNAAAIINAGAAMHVPQRGQTIAVMTALQASSLMAPTHELALRDRLAGLFGVGTAGKPVQTRTDPATSARTFYRGLLAVTGWKNLPPTLAAHAVQHNLDPEAYAGSWSQAVSVVDKLTTGSGPAGLRNLAARAQAVADCDAATVRGRFAINGGTPYVGFFSPTVLDNRALYYAQHGGNGWFEACQHFVAVLDGRPRSGYSTALDAWETFEAAGVAHPVTTADGVSPPVGAWLYYRDSTNPAGHVVVYLGNGQIVSTDVFGRGRVGIGPASAITDGPWHMQYLGWAAPWGQE